MRQKYSVQGFSLIELLVVLVIMGLLAGLVGPRIFGNVDKAKVKTASTQVKMLKGALQAYRLDVGNYPSAEAGLKSLWGKPSGADAKFWQGPYLDDDVPLDPWNKAYQYRPDANNAAEIILFSMGADGEFGGEGTAADVGYLPES